MNAKTLEAIKRHGEALLAAFPNATEKDPIALCKKLRRIEAAVYRPILDYTNGDNGVTDSELDALTERARTRVKAVLGITGEHDLRASSIFVNRDPRGYALKLDDEWIRQENERHYAGKLPAIHTDMGGYGILAPDLNQ